MKERTATGLFELRDAEGRAVNEGAEIKDFRGELRLVTGGIAPAGSWTTGRIELDGCLFYPGVANCAWHRIGY